MSCELKVPIGANINDYTNNIIKNIPYIQSMNLNGMRIFNYNDFSHQMEIYDRKNKTEDDVKPKKRNKRTKYNRKKKRKRKKE